MTSTIVFVGDLVRLRHAPSWFGCVSRLEGDSAVVDSLPHSSTPDVGGWMLPIALLEPVPGAEV